MSALLARLRDSFIEDEEPHSAVFCTFGFDAAFFEAEVLPAVFPKRLPFDRHAGSQSTYLNAGDTALQGRTVTVFYDHLTAEGPQLPIVPVPVRSGAGAFHPKLILLDYEDRLRAVVSSANLSRPAWTTLLETFVIEDLIVGKPHAWRDPLHSFVTHLVKYVPAEREHDVAHMLRRLEKVRPKLRSPTRLASSWDGSLWGQFVKGFPCPTDVDVVTPFFEGTEGPGVFDQLHKFAPGAKGRLFVSAASTEAGHEVRGPAAKLNELRGSGQWTFMRVRDRWDGDDEAAPARGLHGKMIRLRHGERARLMAGSANFTRAALLGMPPNGNVELVVISDLEPSAAAAALPQADRLRAKEIEFVDPIDPTGEDERPTAGLEAWVDGALYWSERQELELRLQSEAPPVVVRYGSSEIGRATAGTTLLPLRLKAEFYIEITHQSDSAIVPLTLADPARFVPRGTNLEVDLEDFCLMLAGHREPFEPHEHPPGGSEPPPGNGSCQLPAKGAIPWRRVLKGIDAIKRELLAEAPYPRGVEHIIKNEVWLGGLQRRLVGERDQGRLTDPDLAFAFHELACMLAGVLASDRMAPESRTAIEASLNEVRGRLRELRTAVNRTVGKQLELLEAEVTA